MAFENIGYFRSLGIFSEISFSWSCVDSSRLRLQLELCRFAVADPEECHHNFDPSRNLTFVALRPVSEIEYLLHLLFTDRRK